MLHIILSHHGSLEHGSPVVPCTREATLVHMIDNLGGRLGSFDRLEEDLLRGRNGPALTRLWESGRISLGGPETARPRRPLVVTRLAVAASENRQIKRHKRLPPLWAG